MTDYSIESLCVLFVQHAQESENHLKELVDSFKKDNPDTEIPKHLICDFSLPRALTVIAEEIVKLKNK